VQEPAIAVPELTILMPCLDEAETLGKCVDKARAFLTARGIPGEILIADNGSTDGSPEIATAHGAQVVHVAERGYGAALDAGFAAARGRYVIMGDADDSYDFSRLDGFLDKLREGYDLVMGNRQVQAPRLVPAVVGEPSIHPRRREAGPHRLGGGRIRRVAADRPGGARGRIVAAEAGARPVSAPSFFCA